MGWYLRWVILKNEGGENAPSINAGFDIAEAKDHIRQMAADMVGQVAIRVYLLSSFLPFQKHTLLTCARFRTYSNSVNTQGEVLPEHVVEEAAKDLVNANNTLTINNDETSATASATTTAASDAGSVMLDPNKRILVCEAEIL